MLNCSRMHLGTVAVLNCSRMYLETVMVSVYCKLHSAIEDRPCSKLEQLSMQVTSLVNLLLSANL